MPRVALQQQKYNLGVKPGNSPALAVEDAHSGVPTHDEVPGGAFVLPLQSTPYCVDHPDLSITKECPMRTVLSTDEHM